MTIRETTDVVSLLSQVEGFDFRLGRRDACFWKQHFVGIESNRRENEAYVKTRVPKEKPRYCYSYSFLMNFTIGTMRENK